MRTRTRIVLRQASLLAAMLVALMAATASPWAQGRGQGQEQEPTPPPLAIAGKWTMSLEMSMGTATITLELKQDAEKITGTYTGNYGTFPLEGVLKGRALEFAVYMSFEGQELTMGFTGEVAEDAQSMKGGATLGELGDASWTAKRAR